MKLLEFASKYPDEASCIAKLRGIKEKGPHICPKCGHVHWYWKNDKVCYECKNRRYFGERLFDRMPVAATSYPPSFKSRVYNSNIATLRR